MSDCIERLCDEIIIIVILYADNNDKVHKIKSYALRNTLVINFA